MTSDEEIINDQYEREIALIKANGNDEDALRLRFEQYHTHDQDLLDHIRRKTLEQIGRKKALMQVHSEIE